MPKACNIDAKGKAARLIWGIVCLVTAVVVAGLIMLSVLPGGWTWAAVVVAALSGALGVYEARAGWCVVRAMGIRTPF